MSTWLRECQCQGNFAASVKAILPIPSLAVPTDPGLFRAFPP
jgi:hypothetical protein